MADEGKVSHALMLIEEGGYGAIPVALSLIQYMACKSHTDGDSCGVCPTCVRIKKLIHPDLHFVFPVNTTSKSGSDKNPKSDDFLPIWRELLTSNPYFTEDILNSEIGIEEKVGVINVAEAKEILSKMSLRSYEGGNKYMIIYLPERMTTEAANRLLKIIEEPFPGTFFFFISQSPERVIATIRSRCLAIRLHPMGYAELATELEKRFGVSAQDALSYAKNSIGSYGKAINLISESGVGSSYYTIITSMLSFALSSDLLSLINGNEKIFSLGREKQKEFCVYAESFLRKILLVQKGLYEIAHITSAEREGIVLFSQKLPETFFPKAYSALENARLSIESNTNAKMVFSNLSNLFFVYLHSAKR